MKFVAATLLLITAFSNAHAESLRCNGSTASIGDSKLAVLQACGEPATTDAYCEDVYVSGSPYKLHHPLPGAYIACKQIEEWLYDRGPGNLIATVRFKSGKIQSIRYGQTPR